MTAIDTALPSLTLVKSFTYRGVSGELWSNTYFMDGDKPSDDASWKTLADAVIAQEKTLYSDAQNVVVAIGHEAGESVAVWSYDYLAASAEVPGTFTVPGVPGAGDSASWIRWSTDQKTSKGKPIYLRSYYHPGYPPSGGPADSVAPSWISAAQDFGDAWITGFIDGDSVTHHRAGPHGAVGLVALPSSFITTRTLERRGKRP